MNGSVIERLNGLKTNGASQSAREAADQLLKRMTSRVHLAVLGPLTDANALLADHLREVLDTSDVTVSITGLDTSFEGVDVGLWCSIAFGSEEARLWAHAPEALREKSFLIVLTNGSGTRLSQAATELFDETIYIPMQDDEAALAHLRNKIAKRIRSAREADEDHAAWLLKSNEAVSLAPIVPPPMLEAADAMLEQHAQVCLTLEPAEEQAYAKAVLESCTEVGQALDEHFDELECAPDLQDLKADVALAHDALVLMSLEGGLPAACDAIERLMQLRQSVQHHLAA